ncbi:hypothetical protein CXF68_08195 [Tenacibaculum sp. Bg11-29]|uniref:hypothetical protein n=1 Tax=Tenacibaculum sp. Bg11-29 TaxID=2058306 RepID=UPI000C3302F1|nr:hypothetical protein [Tenacibaculum sp. Bg11-29]PKH50677.1 hypothetical protein CXF68_08195 [Tenacibaculum sp. Bg11-29]
MKKSILNLGKALNKAEQKEINGGFFFDTSGCHIVGSGDYGIICSACCKKSGNDDSCEPDFTQICMRD